MSANTLGSKIQRKHRVLGIAFIFSFTVSILFPIITSFINRNNKVLKTTGFFDVGIALVCFILFVSLYIINSKQVDEKIIRQTKKLVEYIATIPLLLIAFYLIGLNINWPVLLIGLGWRFWLLIMAVPYIITAFHRAD